MGLLVQALAQKIDVGLTQEGLCLSPVQAQEAGITAGSDEVGQLLPQGHGDGGDHQPDPQRRFGTLGVTESDLVEMLEHRGYELRRDDDLIRGLDPYA